MAFTVAKKTPTQTSQRQESEYDGLWINVGVETEIEGAEGEDAERKFVRLPRGIAVADLEDHKIYANTKPEWAEEAGMANGIMDIIREAGLALEEGEARVLNLQVQVYRRQEQVEAANSSPVDNNALKSAILG